MLQKAIKYDLNKREDKVRTQEDNVIKMSFLSKLIYIM